MLNIGAIELSRAFATRRILGNIERSLSTLGTLNALSIAKFSIFGTRQRATMIKSKIFQPFLKKYNL